jgi:hypothetical protein
VNIFTKLMLVADKKRAKVLLEKDKKKKKNKKTK